MMSAIPTKRFFWRRKTRKVQPLIKNDNCVKTTFAPENNPWEYLLTIYPLLSASVFTPAVSLTADTATTATYLSVTLNAIFTFVSVRRLYLHLKYDALNTRHYFQLLFMLLLTGAGLYLGFLAGQNFDPLLEVFTIINITSAGLNFGFAITEIALPWLVDQAVSTKAKATDSAHLITPSKAFIHTDSYSDEAICAIQGEGDIASKDTTNSYLASLGFYTNYPAQNTERVRQLIGKASCYFYIRIEQYLRQFAGNLKHASMISEFKGNGRGMRKMNDFGRYRSSFDTYFYCANQVLKHISFSQMLLHHIQTQSVITQSVIPDLHQLKLLKQINQNVQIDNLADALKQDSLTDLRPYVIFDHTAKDPDSFNDQVTALCKIATDLLAQEIQKGIKKLNQELFLHSQEIIHLLKARKDIDFSITLFGQDFSGDSEKLIKELETTIKETCNSEFGDKRLTRLNLFNPDHQLAPPPAANTPM